MFGRLTAEFLRKRRSRLPCLTFSSFCTHTLTTVREGNKNPISLAGPPQSPRDDTGLLRLSRISTGDPGSKTPLGAPSLGGTMLEAYTEFRSIQVDRPKPGVLRLTLDRADRLNALDADGHRELADIWRVIDRDQDTLAVLLCAKGRAFSAGGDFKVVEKLTSEFSERANMWRE